MNRFEDARLLTGGGRYVEDVRPAGSLVMRVLRSPIAHGAIDRLDVDAARASPGVVAVLLPQDLTDLGVGAMAVRSPMHNSDGSSLTEPRRPVLAEGEVKYVGQPMAAVIAEGDAAADDAIEAIDFDVTERAAVTDPEAAAADGAPQLWPEAPGNVAIDWDKGNRAETDAAFAGAAHVITCLLYTSDAADE